MRKNRGPNIDLAGQQLLLDRKKKKKNPALTDCSLEEWPFKATLLRLLFRNESINCRAFAFIPLFFRL